jgi:DNA-binding MarR family transcriptional regulator
MRTVPVLPTSRYHALVQLLRTADTVWNASRGFFARWDLSPSEFNVLNLLDGRPEGLSQTELGRELVMHRSNITGLADRLERRGLVQRRDVASDRRAYCVVLTRTGADLLGEILPHYYEAAERTAGHLPLRRAAALIKDLQGIAENAERIVTRLPEEKPQATADEHDPKP